MFTSLRFKGTKRLFKFYIKQNYFSTTTAMHFAPNKLILKKKDEHESRIFNLRKNISEHKQKCEGFLLLS